MLQTDMNVGSANERNSNAREKTRVMLIDDSLILLGDAVGFLLEHPEIEVVSKVCSAKNALAQAELCAPDVVLLDVSCQGVGGLEIIKELHTFNPALPVIVLDMIAMEVVQRAARAAGSSAYVSKEIAPTKLVPAILAVFHGETLQI